MEKDSKKKGAELSIWEEQPRGQFSFSYTGKRESMGGGVGAVEEVDRVPYRHWDFTLRLGSCLSLATYTMTWGRLLNFSVLQFVSSMEWG